MNKQIDTEQGIKGREVHQANQQLAGRDPTTVSNKRRIKSDKWLLVEIWKERREVFKALVEHVLAFTLLIGSLIIFHYLIKIAHLPPEREELLDKIDFYGIALALGIFSISFIYTLVSDAVATARRKKAAERLLKLRMKRILIEETDLSEEEANNRILQQIEKIRILVK
jgi:hypothetical protein